MSVSLLTPDLRRVLSDLARRLAILEQRIVRPVAGTAHSHDGTGGDSSTVMYNSAGGAAATGIFATAVGDDSTASATNATAVGSGATANGNGGTAVGAVSTAGVNATAIGDDATASHTNSVALGYVSNTTGTAQVNMGTRRAFFGAPNSAPADATLINEQVTFYVDQTANTFIVKVKYNDGTVKTGTIALV